MTLLADDIHPSTSLLIMLHVEILLCYVVAYTVGNTYPTKLFPRICKSFGGINNDQTHQYRQE